MTNPSRGPAPGQKLAHYEIVGLIGRGGMGEVHRAHDTKLGRDVALKLLPRELSGEPERTARFEREARTLASLQHPNVASIYGFEEHAGQRFLVMELVEGEDLSRRMARGALSVDEVTDIARQIAAGLEAAHERGIVHRDLKPANVMLTPDHEVKILDFGLARAWFGDAGDENDIGASPTITAAMTAAGTILGTAAYMSPEQARGKAVDRRADIWAFGVILFEMLTAERLFDGETVSDTLAAVLRAEPDWGALPAAEAPLLTRIVERCLVRDPRQRLRDIGEVRVLLQAGDGSAMSLFGAQAPADVPLAAARRGIPVVAIVAIALVTGIVGAWIGSRLLVGTAEPHVVHAAIPPARGTTIQLASSAPGPGVLSPDGRMVAFTARDEAGVTRLYLRHVDRAEPVAISGTESAAYPFWSPDAASIAYFEVGAGAGKLRKVNVGGGPPVTLCPAQNGKGGTWNEDGVILFAPSASSTIHRVPAIGGEPVPITTLAEGEDSHRHPRFLPGGREFLFVGRRGQAGDMGVVYVASLDGGEPRKVAESQAQAEYSRGHLFTVRENALLATPFDLGSLTLDGGAIPVVEDVTIVSEGAVLATYSTSTSGALVFQRGENEDDRELEWVDLRTGASTELPTRGQMFHPSISPDGSTAAVEVYGESQEGADIWLVDLDNGLRTRFTFEPGDEATAVWSPDGAWLYYVTRQGGTSRVLRRAVDGTVDAEELWSDESYVRVTDVADDGSHLLVSREEDAGSAADILVLPLDGSGQAIDFMVGESRTTGAVYSPDGRWIAYYADSAATFDVFVVAADGNSRKWQVSSDTALYPRWSPDGERILAADFNGDLKVYDVDGTGPSFRVGAHRVVAEVGVPLRSGNAFDLHPDGQRVLQAVAVESENGRESLLELVTDWQRALVR